MKKKISHLSHQAPESMPLCDPPDAAYDEFAGDLSYFFLHSRLVNIRYQDRLLSLPGGGHPDPTTPKKIDGTLSQYRTSKNKRFLGKWQGCTDPTWRRGNSG